MFSRFSSLSENLWLIYYFMMGSVFGQSTLCPANIMLFPYCYCSESFAGPIIDCSEANNEDQLEQIFTTAIFPTLNVNEFIIKDNTDIKLLSRNVFGKVSFEVIYFQNVIVEYIDESVFASSFETLTKLTIDNGNLALQGLPFSSLDQYKSLGKMFLNAAGTFEVLPKINSGSMNQLQFTFCGIRYLQDQVFSGMPNLTFIDLGYNYISSLSVSSGIFIQNPLMQHILLDYNVLSKVEEGTFKNLAQLQKVDLSNNVIQLLEPGSFYNLPKLEEIYLQYNSLQSLSVGIVDLLPSLNSVNIYYNYIETVDKDFFANCANVNYVDADKNLLNIIEEGTFDVLKSGVLHLNSNSLTTLDENWLRKVLENNNKVQLLNNPLECDCDMAWLYEEPSLMSNLLARCYNGTNIQSLNPLYFANSC